MAMYSFGTNVTSQNAEDLVDDTIDDTSIVPLANNSFAICELCGRVGRREHFYPRNNKFCSLRCHTSRTRKKNITWRFRFMEGAEHMAGMIPLEPLPQLHQWQATYTDLQAGPIKHSAAAIANSYEWKDELFGCDFLAAPVSLFKHAPLHEMWDSTFEGMKVEVRNNDSENYSEKLSDYFWVATVLKVKGYMGLLRYEGFGSDPSKDFWVNLCCSEVHPVGWCATRGKPLIPPKTIEDKYTDWKKFLVKQLTGARTLPANFYTKLNDSIKSRFSIGSVMEVVDKNRISQVKVASVVEIIGKRLHVKYYDSSPEDNGFWCHEDSPLIHPVGWAFRIGHVLDAPPTYCQRVAAGRIMPSDTTSDMFYQYPTNEPPLFSEGMKLEAIDPLNLSAICAATVMRILNEGYMMIRIDCYPPEQGGADWFCYHQRSPCIFPLGFALANNIPLIPPIGYSAETFNWETYLMMTNSQPADRSIFMARGHVVSHGFVAGMKVECADLMDPRLVCVATIATTVSDMLKVHFDGWGAEYDQWLWAHSTDIYPVGWCRAVGHRLEGPLQANPKPAMRKVPPKPTRRRRRPVKEAPTKTVVQPPFTNEESSQNSEMGNVKSISPPTSVSELSADAELPPSAIGNVSPPALADVTPSAISDVPPAAISNVPPSAISDVPPTANPTGNGYSSSHELTVSNNHDLKLEPSDPNMEVDEEQNNIEQNVTEPIAANEMMEDVPDPPVAPIEAVQDTPTNVQNDPESSQDKVIPRLVNTAVPLDVLNSVEPETWTTEDVAKFLTVNDCQPYCINFANITGPMMLQLSKDEIIELLEMKVGPSLKIFDLIQQLKCKIKQPQRLLGR